jgi:ELWxxDGT repeat protein
VADINNGTGGSRPGYYIEILVGDTLYFSADDGSTGHELWAHDTSNGSTWRVEDINPGSDRSNPGQYMYFFLGDSLYFSADDGITGIELWAYNLSSINYQTNTGGNVTSWAINGSLPSGVSFNTQTGVLSGTPTELWPQTSYMVWANNSGGSSVAYLNITVVDELPTLSYSPSALVLTINTSSSDLPLNATLTGSGTITSWAISPALPSGLSFGTSNGTIWGTPTSMMTLKTFTIWANNSGGSSSATVNITVNDEAPDLSYNPDWFVLTNNTAMSPTATPTNSGGEIPSGILDSNGNVGEYTSIAIDSNGFKHISYYDATIYGTPVATLDLKYATDTSGSWVVTTVDTAGNVGKYTSIAIDSNDVVHISYFDDTNNDLKYATCSSGCTTASNWDLVSVDTTSTNAGEYTSIAVDSNDGVHISYFDNSNLRYATCSSGCISASNWTNVSVYTSGGAYTSIAIDSNDTLHIAYITHPSPTLRYTTCSSGCTNASNWTNVSIPYAQSPYGLRDVSLAIDSNGAPHISYYDNSNKDLKYAACSSGCTTASNWNLVTLDSVGDTGYYTSIAIDSNDAIHISYRDNTNQDLKYATCSSGCTSGSNWNKVTLDATGNTGYDTSIAIDANDAVHIVHRDFTNGDLKYIALDSSSNVYGYSISPDLPAGLSFNAFTGEISGTPTELLTNTTFTITARNSGGTNTTTITIEVIDTLPTVSYSPENLTLMNNTASSNLPLAPTITGSGAITSWALNNTSLPSGISFNTSSGTFSGTPTELWPQTSYMVWANNSGGSSVAYLNITVVDDVPVLSYTPASVELTNNTAHPDFPLLATVTGSGVITSWAINDSALPTGVFFGTTNGTFWGTPTQLWPVTSYTVWANNSGGSTSATVTISVIDQVPTLAYSPSSVEMTNNTANSDFPLAPSLSGAGDITSWAINDSALPAGVFFGTDNGTFWGVPTQLWPARTYTVWANNSGGSTSATVTLEVVDQVPVLSYSPDAVDMVNNTAHADFPLAATLTGPGEVLGWVLNNSALPSGVFFGTTNGTFWGTPTELWPETTYTIWANNSGGSTSATVTISVVDQVPVLSYSPNTIELRNNTAHNSMPLEAILTGPGDITSWAVNDSALPTGLFFGATNGTFWGTPTQLWPVTSYTVWANNSGGSTSATVTISVVDQIPTLAYVPSALVLVNNTAHADMPLHAVLTGPGEITSWAINDTVLPTGLNFGTTNGTFWGTPTALWPSTSYTVWANNSGGSVLATVTFGVIDQIPTFAASSVSFQFTNNTTSPDLPFTPVLNGPGLITSWAMNGTLPAGLFFEPSNATLWGVPTQLWPSTSYTIWANNSGGSSALSVTLEVVDQLPVLSYAPATLALVNNTAHADLPLEATLTGPGEITSWVLVGALPEGLSFGTTNGTVWGIATELWPSTTYTVWANNSGGSSSATLVISVVDQLPTLSYVPDVVVLTNNTAHADLPLHAVLTGPGEITSWALVGELPEGLTFEVSNGTLWGVATELWPETTYTVWANNSGGSSSATLTITVIDQLPSIAFVPDVLDLVKHTPHADLPLAPVVVGPGLITSWAIDQALPFGVQFSTENGTFWGTPTELWPARTYTVWANNSGGSATATVTISVVDQVPTLSYTPEHLTLVVMESSNDLPLVATLDGPGDITSWVLSEALPQGMFFSTTNGTVYGMAEEVWSNRTYTVWANNSGGSTSATFSLEVISQTPRLLYAENLVLIAGDAMPSWQPFVLYGSVDTWAIEPDPPDGLVFNDVLGRITGTPTTPAEAMTWTVWTNATGVAVPWNLTITVLLDTDDDGMPNALPEGYLGALIEDLDDDNDGLLDIFETNTGVFLGPDDIGTNPLVVDTDADTWDDAEEVSCGADPTNASDVPVDTDGDGLCDALEADPDGDGYSTQEELACSSDPMNATSIPVDIDGDGACDALLQPELSYTNVSDTGTGVILLGHPARFDAVVIDAALEAWTIEPALPEGLVFNATDGSITGVVQDSDGQRPSSTHTVFATEVGYGRIIEVEVTFTYAKDSDGDGLADSDPDGFGPMRGDLDDDDDGWNDTIEAACGSNPLDASSYPSADFTLVDGACVDASAKPLPPADEGPQLFTLFMLFWVAVILLALVHRKNERREHRKNIAAEKDEAISKMIADSKATEDA